MITKVFLSCLVLLLCACSVKTQVHRIAFGLDISKSICILPDEKQKKDPTFTQISELVATRLLEQGHLVKDSGCDYNLRMSYSVDQYGQDGARLQWHLAPRVSFADEIVFTKRFEVDILDNDKDPIFYADSSLLSQGEDFLPTGMCMIYAVFGNINKNNSIASYEQNALISVPYSRCNVNPIKKVINLIFPGS